MNRVRMNMPSNATGQRGAALVVAIIMLLVITVLAISGARESALESRIVGNFIEQQRLLTGAESGLRDGEKSVTKSITPLDPTAECDSGRPCLRTLGANYTYAIDFNDADLYKEYAPTDGTEANKDSEVVWYGMPAPSGGQDGESENPEYGSMLLGTGVFRYEINTQAKNTVSNNFTLLRSVVAKLFDAGN